MKIVVVNRRGDVKAEYEFADSDRIGELKKRYFVDNKVSVNRQRFSVNTQLSDKPPPPPKSGKKPRKLVLSDDTKSFKDYGIDESKIERLELEFKDLGPQIGWQTVFILEYAGPMVMHALPYFFPRLFYGEDFPTSAKSLTQIVAFWLVMFHYCKREFESIFVHRFSNATMPWLNIFKNCGHYWIFGGLIISYFLYHPRYTAPFTDPTIIYALAAVMIISEFGNLHAHITLRNLRPPGTKTRGIPKGQMFGLVSCANYFWELSSWFYFAILTSCLTSWIFLVASFVPMYAWALKKHKRYKKEFPDYPKVRKALIPFII